MIASHVDPAATERVCYRALYGLTAEVLTDRYAG